MENNLSLDDLTVFLAILEEGGFRAAAKRLGIAPSKVSTTVTRMEHQLGVPLLYRTTRSLSPTERGQQLAERIAPHLAEITSACVETSRSGQKVSGRLKLNVPGAVMPDVLPPILSAFQDANPDVAIEILVENQLVDMVTLGCDAGIRYGKALERDMISIPIGPRSQSFALAASPDYVKRHGLPKAPEDLPGHDAIRYRLLDGPLLPWTLRRREDIFEVRPRTRLVLSVNALDTGLAFARCSMGIIGVFENWLERDFASGTLVPVLREFWVTMEGPRLYYPNRLASAPLRAFIEFCRQHQPRHAAATVS